MGHQLGVTADVQFTDRKAASRVGSVASATDGLATEANYASEATLDARLLAMGGMYTQAVIDRMTQNDKVYAVRLNDDASSV